MTNQEKREIRQYIDNAIKAYIDSAIRKTVNELKKQGLINEDHKAGYAEVITRLKVYYKNNKQDEALTDALSKLQDDPYIDIIPLYYFSMYTLEQIASVYNCDLSTITRNKKRLCKEIYKLLEGSKKDA